jgi:ribosomal-protein-serine acetyltransferase
MMQAIDPGEAESEIDALAAAFFAVFDNRSALRVDLDKLRTLCIPQALLIKAVGPVPEICHMDAFIAPRERLLNGGTLTDFHERELSARTEIFGNVVQRWCRYRKAGVLEGRAFASEGMKGLQFLRTLQGWRISAVLWGDEPA